jgi:hypothetical protein
MTDFFDSIVARYVEAGFDPATARRMALDDLYGPREPRERFESWEDRMAREVGVRRWGEI